MLTRSVLNKTDPLICKVMRHRMSHNPNDCKLRVDSTFLPGGVDNDSFTSSLKPTGTLGSGALGFFKEKKRKGEEERERREGGEGEGKERMREEERK